MIINILGCNIFSKGGTSRSNINLIKSLLEAHHKVNYYNYLPFTNDDIVKLLIHEALDNKLLSLNHYVSDKDLSTGDIVILTRKSFFHYSRNIKAHNNNIKIVGEIHGPLKYITDDIDLSLETIDCVRVSTENIKEHFIKKYKYHNVFSQYVNARHIKLNEKPINTKRNFMIKARFEDNIKDISYVIKLFNYIIKNNIVSDIKLYIIGYGPSELLYKNLIRYYNLEEHIYINRKEPKSYIYISSSPYETLGYSILETIANGNKALIYPGDDKVLKDIYNEYNAVDFLTKDILKDSLILKNILHYKYNYSDRLKDYQRLLNTFINNKYEVNLLNNIEKYSQNKTIKVKKRYSNLYKQSLIKVKRTPFSTLKDSKFIKLVLKSRIINKIVKRFYQKNHNERSIKTLNRIQVNRKFVFIESFHGKNFSGDPKYIALAIKKAYKDMEIYVSSGNSLVDMEIKRYGLIPVRFGSNNYVNIFRKCKYVFMNGNSLDKVYKGNDQIFVQTWHGFPLKKMVSDLNNEIEREKQFNAFNPRMMKWDFLITSSEINTILLNSAFKLESNKNLVTLEFGAPRNQYLINNNNSNEKQLIQQKYLFKVNDEKKYILYCPTWRKEKRNQITNLKLTELLSYLPSNYEIIVKLHPNESNLRTKYNGLSERIHCFYNEFVDIQELYILSECMITDYSSTIFDYIHLNKPIFILQEDQKDYVDDIGFYFDLFELGYFPIASLNEERLAQQIQKIKSINYSNIKNRLMNKDNKNSTENILEAVFKNTNN